MSSTDPFYLVRDEIQDAANKVQDAFSRFERLPASSSEREGLVKGLLEECSSVEWQLEELNRAVAVAAREPERFGINLNEIERRKKWISSTTYQVGLVSRALQAAAAEREGMRKEAARRELLRSEAEMSGGRKARGGGGGGDSHGMDGDSFVSTDDDRQALIMREQDEQLDEMSKSLAKIGGMGIAIHEELGMQDKLIGELTEGVDNTNSRLELVQKKMVAVLKKAGFKGQLVILVSLILLMIILIVLLTYS